MKKLTQDEMIQIVKDLPEEVIPEGAQYYSFCKDDFHHDISESFERFENEWLFFFDDQWTSFGIVCAEPQDFYRIPLTVRAEL